MTFIYLKFIARIQKLNMPMELNIHLYKKKSNMTYFSFIKRFFQIHWSFTVK